jgi:glutamate racemase
MAPGRLFSAGCRFFKIGTDMNSDRPIGVFDTGVGGLSVVGEMLKVLPGERVVYFADRARQPYGALPHEVAEGLVLESLQFLLDQGAKAIVIACNTASAAGYEAARKRFPVPVFSVIGPGIPAACKATRNKRVGLIGTKGTVESHAHAGIFAALDPAIQVFGQACPLLPPLIELGKVDADDTRLAVETYLQPLKEQDIDTLMLGCTHFPFIHRLIRDTLGGNVGIVDPNAYLVQELREVLTEKNSLGGGIAGEGEHRFIVSRFPEIFQQVGSMLLGRPIRRVEEILVGKPVEGYEIPEMDMYDPEKKNDVHEFLKA